MHQGSRGAARDRRPRRSRGFLTRIGAAVTILVVGCGGAPRDDLVDAALRVAIPRDSGPLHPYSGASPDMLGLVFDKLFEPSPYVDAPTPALAIEARQVDEITWSVALRPDVTWHDGEPFTATDVAFTFAYYRDGPPNRYTHHVSEVPQIDEIRADDELSVTFVCAYPCPTLVRITLADLPIIPAHVWRGVSEPRAHAEVPVGTGPYRLVEYRSDRYYRFIRNDDYFLGQPAIEELVMPIIPSPSSALIALRNGEVDVTTHELPPELQGEFADLEGIRTRRTSALSIVELRPNYRKAPFSEPTLRRALALAVDRDELVDRVLLGLARPGHRGYPHPDSPWTDPALRTPFDRPAAAAMLREAGFVDRDGDGVRERADVGPLRFGLLVSADATLVRVAELLAEQFRPVGIDLTVETLEATALSQIVGAGDYDLFVSEIGAHGVADPDQFVMSHRTGYLWRRDIPYPEWDALFEEWRKTTTVADRLAVLHRMQRLFNRQPTSVALYYPEQVWAFRPEAFDGWRESLGYGIVHKWSFMPDAVP